MVLTRTRSRYKQLVVKILQYSPYNNSMGSDFYLLKNTRVNLSSDLKFEVLKNKAKPISSKVILTALTLENFMFLKEIDKNILNNCVFIYLKIPIENEPIDLNLWTPIFNNFLPSNIIHINKLNNSHLNHAIHTLRKKEHNASLKKLIADDKAFFYEQKKTQLKDLLNFEQKLVRNKKKIKSSHLNEMLNLNCLESIFNSKSIDEMESKITSILRKHFHIDWVHIRIFQSEILTKLSTIEFQNQFETKSFDLDYNSKTQGRVIFASKKGTYIKKSTNPLLQKISDALSLRLKQITTENEIEHSNLQWESTFKALPFKAALINKNFKILEYGGKFNTKKIKKSKSSLCYEKFFGRNKPCKGCKLGENFLMEHKNDSLEVNSKKIFDPVNDDHYYLNFYRDFEVSTLGESSKATRAKLEEFGIISGSIAHELNNPLGGIKILLELLNEDKNLSSPDEKQDLKVLMESTNKCINIVDELLNFTRLKHSGSQSKPQTLLKYFKQLKIFTQAYLLSKGIILEIIKGDYLDQKILSPDSTLSIKLLEAVAHLNKKLNRSSLESIQTLYLYASLPQKNLLKIILSSKKPLKTPLPSQHLKNKLKPQPIFITPINGSFENFIDSNQEQTLTLNFSTEVKLNETHV